MSGSIIAFGGLGPVELVVILLVALLVFGRRLPEVARSMGQGLVEFRKGLRDDPTDDPKPLPESTTEEEGTTEDNGYPEVVDEREDGTDEEEGAEDSGDEEKSPAG
jgi:TatA/E family protein of Tat protein translocase